LWFGFGLTGGGVRVLCLTSGASSCGSGGSLNVRCGLGDRTGGGECWATLKGLGLGLVVGVAARPRSNIFTRDVVGGMGVSSVGLWSCDSRLSLLLALAVGCRVSSLARTLPTLPEGGSMSLSFACRSLTMGAVA
jgi:hypothetical protein